VVCQDRRFFIGSGRARGRCRDGDDLAWSAGVVFAETGTRRPAQKSRGRYSGSLDHQEFTGTAVIQLRDRSAWSGYPASLSAELRSAVSPFRPIEAVTIADALHESGLEPSRRNRLVVPVSRLLPAYLSGHGSMINGNVMATGGLDWRAGLGSDGMQAGPVVTG